MVTSYDLLQADEVHRLAKTYGTDTKKQGIDNNQTALHRKTRKKDKITYKKLIYSVKTRGNPADDVDDDDMKSSE